MTVPAVCVPAGSEETSGLIFILTPDSGRTTGGGGAQTQLMDGVSQMWNFNCGDEQQIKHCLVAAVHIPLIVRNLRCKMKSTCACACKDTVEQQGETCFTG